MNAPLVVLRNAGVALAGHRALDGVSLAVGRGDRIALVGANGAGKTTLLRALHGLAPLSAGARTLAAPAPRIAMLFQRPYLARLSVRANVELALWLAGVARRERRARAEGALERVGLADALRRPAQALSVGQQQRVALARALAVQADLLLLDEPTASLDPDAARDIEALIDRVAGHAMALVMASHDMAQVRRLARRVVALERGRVQADVGVPEFFAAVPRTPAARFGFDIPEELPCSP